MQVNFNGLLKEGKATVGDLIDRLVLVPRKHHIKLLRNILTILPADDNPIGLDSLDPQQGSQNITIAPCFNEAPLYIKNIPGDTFDDALNNLSRKLGWHKCVIDDLCFLIDPAQYDERTPTLAIPSLLEHCDLHGVWRVVLHGRHEIGQRPNFPTISTDFCQL